MINYRQAKAYCCEDISLIENYEAAMADTTQTWHCHHKLELFMTRKELIDIGRCYNVLARELVFLTPKEHCWWPHKGNEEAREKISEALLGKQLSDETKEKMREARLGEKNPMFGKHHSEEAKKKMREAHLGKISGNKGKHLSDEAKAKRSKAVQQLDLQTGEIIAEFPSVIEAQRHTGIGNISKACNGHLRKAGGYRWRFKEDSI